MTPRDGGARWAAGGGREEGAGGVAGLARVLLLRLLTLDVINMGRTVRGK